MNNINKLIENLNKEQKEAVLNTEGPNLIVAGAGSGKTRVLTTRLIHIINQKKAWANQILCVTFTNKAAKEMQNRVMNFIKGTCCPHYDEEPQRKHALKKFILAKKVKNIYAVDGGVALHIKNEKNFKSVVFRKDKSSYEVSSKKGNIIEKSFRKVILL